MLNQISWADYISTIIAVTILYYLFTGGHYYGRDILQYISARSKSTDTSISFGPGQIQPAFVPDELKAFLSEARDSDIATMLSGIQYILNRYEFDEEKKNNVNTYIKNNCSVTLTEDELRGIWTK